MDNKLKFLYYSKRYKRRVDAGGYTKRTIGCAPKHEGGKSRQIRSFANTEM